MQSLKNIAVRRAPAPTRKHLRRNARRAVFMAAALSLGSFAVVRAETAPLQRQGQAVRPAGESREARLARWKESFDAFAEADRQRAPAAGGVLFVGSSSIRLWDDLERDFKTLPIVTKRGFGGSRLSDCTEQVARLVLPYKPSVVVVYAGDNDLAEGATPQDVADSFKRLVEAVRAELPDTRIAYLSIKPSPSRALLMAQVREANSLISAYTQSVANLDFIDVYTKMIGTDGKPRGELFAPDMLHLNRAGYSLWQSEISARLSPISADATSAKAASRLLQTVGDAGVPRDAR